MKAATAGKIFYLSTTFLSVTIGIPFCVFKYLFGMLVHRRGELLQDPSLACFGWIVMLWAGIDLILNILRSLMAFLGRETTTQFCLIAQVGVIFKRPTLFLALDTLVSFMIICFVLWSGWILQLKPHESYLWYAATTVNLISLAVVEVWTEYHRNSDRADREEAD